MTARTFLAQDGAWVPLSDPPHAPAPPAPPTIWRVAPIADVDRRGWIRARANWFATRDAAQDAIDALSLYPAHTPSELQIRPVEVAAPAQGSRDALDAFAVGAVLHAEQFLPRGRAAALVDAVRRLLAQRVDPERIEAYLGRQFAIPPLRPCQGEAHSNPNIDSCSVCAPRFGWVGPRVGIR